MNLTLLCLLAASHASAAEDSTFVAQRKDPRLPSAEAALVGINPARLKKLARKIDAPESKRVDAVLLLREGKLVFEKYQNGHGPKRLHDIASITKAITSLLVGIAIDKGHLSGVDEQVWRFFEGTPHEELWPEDKKLITIRHLLSMQHGLGCDDHDDPGMKAFQKWLQSDDPVAEVLALPMRCEPGTKTAYCTSSTQLLQRVLEKATGMPVDRFARASLFEPLGIRDFRWRRLGKDRIGMGFGGAATPRDLAVIGRMIEQDGKWQGRKIVSRQWLRESFKARGKLLGVDYGYLWYSEPYRMGDKWISSRLAMGHGGQFLILIPDLNVIVVIVASDYEQQFDFYGLVQEFVVPACEAR